MGSGAAAPQLRKGPSGSLGSAGGRMGFTTRRKPLSQAFPSLGEDLGVRLDALSFMGLILYRFSFHPFTKGLMQTWRCDTNYPCPVSVKNMVLNSLKKRISMCLGLGIVFVNY